MRLFNVACMPKEEYNSLGLKEKILWLTFIGSILIYVISFVCNHIVEGKDIINDNINKFQNERDLENSMRWPISVNKTFGFKASRNITNEQFYWFTQAFPEYITGSIDQKLTDKDYLNHWSDNKPSIGSNKSPVVYVSQPISQKFCESVGGTLPTKKEWLAIIDQQAKNLIIHCCDEGCDSYTKVDNNECYKELATSETDYDLRGNVAEWLYKTSASKAYHMGGSFNANMSEILLTIPGEVALNTTAPDIGFICIKYN